MIKVDKVQVYNFENAVRGARNPMNSWEKSDSFLDEQNHFRLGSQDLQLLKRLCSAGTDHRKFTRQIFISMDITAPLYWWKEFDTYKVGTTTNSTSTMHKIHSKPFQLEDFSCDQMSEEAVEILKELIVKLENMRKDFLADKDKTKWYSMIQLLPAGYNQLRTCSLSYENAVNMYFARKSHKLDEWQILCKKFEELPYFKELFLE